jgi:hypothetical protein
MGEEKKPTGYNIIKHRGSPTEATTAAGHKVTKQEFIVTPSPFNVDQIVTIQCADYHDEHFVYLDPLFFEDIPPDSGMAVWWAMCTCGSKAIVIGGADVSEHLDQNWIQEILARGGKNVDNMLVCEHYHERMVMHGHGWHQGQSGRKWT